MKIVYFQINLISNYFKISCFVNYSSDFSAQMSISSCRGNFGQGNFGRGNFDHFQMRLETMGFIKTSLFLANMVQKMCNFIKIMITFMLKYLQKI